MYKDEEDDLMIVNIWDYQLNFSKSLESSFLLGVNEFDFSTVIEDPCSSSSKSMIRRVKITACGSGQFTCDDGQCVTMDERCNQISNCRYVQRGYFCMMEQWVNG